jgi:hypothetical protein
MFPPLDLLRYGLNDTAYLHDQVHVGDASGHNLDHLHNDPSELDLHLLRQFVVFVYVREQLCARHLYLVQRVPSQQDYSIDESLALHKYSHDVLGPGGGVGYRLQTVRDALV